MYDRYEVECVGLYRLQITGLYPLQDYWNNVNTGLGHTGCVCKPKCDTIGQELCLTNYDV